MDCWVVFGVKECCVPGHPAHKLRHHLVSLLDNTQAVDMFYTNTSCCCGSEAYNQPLRLLF